MADGRHIALLTMLLLINVLNILDIHITSRPGITKNCMFDHKCVLICCIKKHTKLSMPAQLETVLNPTT